MTNKRMYFGTKERMTWIPMPAINAGISKARWSSEGVFLNGGGYVRRSSVGHMKYDLSWNLLSHKDIFPIADYDDGVYGGGLIYFIDPFAAQSNVLPQMWASPRLQAEGAPTLVRNKVPELMETGLNDYAYPTQSVRYELEPNDEFRTLWVPVPDGHTFHFGAHGNRTGTAEITVQEDLGPVQSVSMLSTNTATLTNVAIPGPSGVTISARGSGYLTIAGMIGRILPTGKAAPIGVFMGGRGHSGCRFNNAGLTLTGYSAPSALDKVGASATLIETGAWEQ